MSFSVTGKGVLKAEIYSFQVGDVLFCGFYPALPLNGGFWPGGYVRGVMSGHRSVMAQSVRPASLHKKAAIFSDVTTNTFLDFYFWTFNIDNLYDYIAQCKMPLIIV